MQTTEHFRSLHFGREQLWANESIPRHRHCEGYIALVLAGSYQEAGIEGRRRVSPGDVLVHYPFDMHLNSLGGQGAELINLPFPLGMDLPVAFRIDDADAVVRLAQRDPLAASQSLRPVAELAAQADWPDLLAADLRSGGELVLRDWAAAAGIAPETISRGFKKAYGVSPARYRCEARVRHALKLIVDGLQGLASIASDCGFADQPHLSREIRAVTGRTPGEWRQGQLRSRH